MHRLADFQEKEFIHKVLGPLALTAHKDSFDDAIVIDLAEITSNKDAPFLIYSMDQPYLIQHGDRGLDNFRFYGRWIAGTTSNDVIAMGGRCRGFSLALSAPSDMTVDRIQAMTEGIADVLQRIGAVYEGGNFHNGDLATVGVSWGLAPRRGIVRRVGAGQGDKIVVTGELGFGWLEYQLRKYELSRMIVPGDAEKFRHYKSMPIGAAAAIADGAEQVCFTSGMDLSDGLVEFLYTIRSRNGVGCVVDADALPVSPAARRNLGLLRHIDGRLGDILAKKPYLLALDPGYDSPLRHAFTVRPGALRSLKEIFRAHGTDLHVIGEVVGDPLVLIREEEHMREIPPFWDDNLRQDSPMTAWREFISTFEAGA